MTRKVKPTRSKHKPAAPPDPPPAAEQSEHVQQRPLDPDHLVYAPAYHLARLHRGSGGLCWSVGLGFVLLWMTFFPIGAFGPLGEVLAMVLVAMLILPWSVATSKHAHRLTDRWPDPGGSSVFFRFWRTLAVIMPMAALLTAMLVLAIRLTWPPDSMQRIANIFGTARESIFVLVLLVVAMLAIGVGFLWLRAGSLIPRARVVEGPHRLAFLRLWIGIGTGLVGVCVLTLLDLLARQQVGAVNPVATIAVLVFGVLAVLFASTFGSLHARLWIIIREIEHAEDELRRRERNRLGILPGDPSMNEAEASPDPRPIEHEREIGPIGGHPDPPGT